MGNKGKGKSGFFFSPPSSFHPTLKGGEMRNLEKRRRISILGKEDS